MSRSGAVPLRRAGRHRTRIQDTPPPSEGLVEDILLLPELEDGLLQPGKENVGWYGFEHRATPRVHNTPKCQLLQTKRKKYRKCHPFSSRLARRYASEGEYLSGGRPACRFPAAPDCCPQAACCPPVLRGICRQNRRRSTARWCHPGTWRVHPLNGDIAQAVRPQIAGDLLRAHPVGDQLARIGKIDPVKTGVAGGRGR